MGGEESGKMIQQEAWQRGNSIFENMKIHGPSSGTHTGSERKEDMSMTIKFLSAGRLNRYLAYDS